MSAKTNAPIIIKRKKIIAGGGHHGGAWKVAIRFPFRLTTLLRRVEFSPGRRDLRHSDGCRHPTFRRLRHPLGCRVKLASRC